MPLVGAAINTPLRSIRFSPIFPIEAAAILIKFRSESSGLVRLPISSVLYRIVVLTSNDNKRKLVYKY